jgi:hypothetical protein
MLIPMGSELVLKKRKGISGHQSRPLQGKYLIF